MITLENLTMPNVDLAALMQHLTQTGKRTHQIWLNDETLAFVARGREYRSEFHINPSYEIQYSLKGAQDLLYRTAQGEIKVAHMPEGSVFCQPPFVPHSPPFCAGCLPVHYRARAQTWRNRQIPMVLPPLRPSYPRRKFFCR